MNVNFIQLKILYSLINVYTKVTSMEKIQLEKLCVENLDSKWVLCVQHCHGRYGINDSLNTF